MTEQKPEIPEKQTETIPPKPCCQPKTILLVILGFVIMAGIVYAAYFFGKKSVPNFPVVQTSQPVEITQIPSKTANWKTYTNAKYKYSIKYPSDWRTKEESSGNIFTFFLNPQPLIYPEADTEGPIPAIEIILRQGNKAGDIEKIVEQNFGTDIPKESQSIINNLPARRFEVVPSDGYFQGEKIVEVYVPTDLGLLVLRNNKTSSLEIFNQILSTFKFLP